MELLPTVLVLCSTLMHAAWNLIIKSQGGAQDSLWRMHLYIVVMGAAPALASLAADPCLTAPAVVCLLGSGACCGIYYFGLSKGYDAGDFTTVYPASRALPVLLIGIGDALRGHPPNLLGWAGMLLVTAGCFFVPLRSLSDIRLSHYLRPVSLWIGLTALGTVGYSLFDKIGTEAIPRGPREAAVYCYFFHVVSFVSLHGLRRLTSGAVASARKAGWRVPAAAGTLCFMAYWLVLWAYQMVAQASYVVAFRQFSIVVGMLMALFVLNESGKAVRFIGALSITAGLLLLKVFGS